MRKHNINNLKNKKEVLKNINNKKIIIYDKTRCRQIGRKDKGRKRYKCLKQGKQKLKGQSQRETNKRGGRVIIRMMENISESPKKRYVKLRTLEEAEWPIKRDKKERK